MLMVVYLCHHKRRFSLKQLILSAVHTVFLIILEDNWL